MKKYLLLLFSLIISANSLFAEIIKIDGLYYSLGSTTAIVVADQSSDKSVYSAYTSVTIPASVTWNNYEYPVTSIGSNAFKNCTNLQSAVLPNSLTIIGTSAFESCSNLQTVNIPSSVTAINTDAFYYCSKLGSIDLPEGLLSIGERAFYHCNLTSITVPSTVTSVGNAAFKENPTTTVVWKPVNCTVGTDTSAPFYSTSSKITSFTFADGVQIVPSYICKNMSKLDTIVLPPSVNRLGQNAFMYCTSLKSINLPVTQKTLPVGIFEGCTSLESIELPATLTTISTDAFYGCTSLKNVNLHEGITTIYNRAFYNCKLSSVTIPSTVTSIGNAAFKSNPLTSVIWLPKNCSIGTGEDAPFYSTSSQITSFTFGDSVQTIPAYLCKNMSRLDTVVLPPSVSSLGQYAFAYCTSLKSINLPVAQKTLPTSFLEGCSSLESIELPATLTTISTDAFYGCTSLKNVNLHEGITTIYNRAFYNCKLENITIPSTVTSIGNGAFKSNPTKSVVWLPATCSIGTGEDAPFYSTSSQITSFVFSDSVKTIPGYLCFKMNKLSNIALPETVTTIGQYAFNSCSLLKEVTIPASVTSINTYAFAFCTSLKNFEFPKGIKTVATSVLEGCTALLSVVIPSTVNSINQDAFYGCSGLQEIYNYAFTPQTITERAVYNVNKQTCILYVPMDYIDLYRAKAVWCDFINIIGVATDLQFEEQIVNVTYLKADSTLHYMEVQNWEVPHAPRIDGFEFVKWQVQAGDLADGIVLVAVYEAKQGTDAQEVYVNPANKAQKLIRNGNVYILSDDQVYTITGKRLK